MIKYKFKIPNKIGDDEQLNCMSKLAFGKRHWNWQSYCIL